MNDAPHTVTSDTGAFNTTNNLTENQTFMFQNLAHQCRLARKAHSATHPFKVLLFCSTAHQEKEQGQMLYAMDEE